MEATEIELVTLSDIPELTAGERRLIETQHRKQFTRGMNFAYEWLNNGGGKASLAVMIDAAMDTLIHHDHSSHFQGQLRKIGKTGDTSEYSKRWKHYDRRT